jgi:hypothetical protein
MRALPKWPNGLHKHLSYWRVSFANPIITLTKGGKTNYRSQQTNNCHIQYSKWILKIQLGQHINNSHNYKSWRPKLISSPYPWVERWLNYGGQIEGWQRLIPPRHDLKLFEREAMCNPSRECFKHLHLGANKTCQKWQESKTQPIVYSCK